MKYSQIEAYWNRNPCNGGLQSFAFQFFRKQKVLEIGCGTGNDALCFVNAGAKYTGIDLTDIAVELTKDKVGKRGIVHKMNAEYLDFPDRYFDAVYSFGVIHHTLHPEKVMDEIYRVLKSHGIVIIMVYNKFSMRYFVDIMGIRRLLWFCNYYKYKDIKQRIPYPTYDQWISMNTDNLGCPVSRIYSKRQALKLMKRFRKVSTFTKNKGWFRFLMGCK